MTDVFFDGEFFSSIYAKKGYFLHLATIFVIRANDKEASFRGLTLDSYYYKKGGTGLPGRPLRVRNEGGNGR